MNFTFDLMSPLVWPPLLLAVVVSLAAVAQPWRTGGSTFVDRWRIGIAAVRYDFWLDLRGVNRRRRRDLREELRGNLAAAAEQVGTVRALAAVGSLRRMAAEAIPSAEVGPHWNTGGLAAAGAFFVVTMLELFSIITWSSAAEASGVDRVQGSLPLFPGSHATWDGIDGGFSLALEPGWLVLAASTIAFLLGSRPWLAISRHRQAAAR